MWKIIYHNAGALRGEYDSREEAKMHLYELVKEVSKGTIQFTYTDYPNMSDIIRNGEVIGAIVYVGS